MKGLMVFYLRISSFVLVAAYITHIHSISTQTHSVRKRGSRAPCNSIEISYFNFSNTVMS